MKQNGNNGQKGFTAALMVLSMIISTGIGTYVLYQAEHGKAGILSAYVDSVKYSKDNLYSESQDHPVAFKKVLQECQTPAGVKGGLPASVCHNVHYVNTQLLGNYS
ncbi:hypothetical protein [Acidithiobacillus sp.]